MKLTIKKNDIKLIVEHAREGLPNEACGLIAGTMEGEIKTIQKVYLLSNPDQSPEHFSIEPKEHLSAIKDMRANGWLPLGNFHSHPSTPARPSKEDIRLAYDPFASYLILSLAEDVPVLKAFGITGDVVEQQEIVVIP
ncbi:M67 family metallopeptidase [Lacrimispora sp.]|uniref:M67 family metallopeptidase n=1 Tax=Lacrimispora sp. TaxID=2719234 RepID=UPI0028AA9F0F|nr:M67 family metallopeptidase [Lacrimispora sp.]